MLQLMKHAKRVSKPYQGIEKENRKTRHREVVVKWCFLAVAWVKPWTTTNENGTHRDESSKAAPVYTENLNSPPRQDPPSMHHCRAILVTMVRILAAVEQHLGRRRHAF